MTTKTFHPIPSNAGRNGFYLSIEESHFPGTLLFAQEASKLDATQELPATHLHLVSIKDETVPTTKPIPIVASSSRRDDSAFIKQAVDDYLRGLSDGKQTTTWIGHIESSYSLSAENRSYDQHMGVFDKAKMHKSQRFGLTENGCEETSLGALELADRFSFLDLNDSGINGGILKQNSVGLNWYLTDNLKMQFMNNNATRDA